MRVQTPPESSQPTAQNSALLCVSQAAIRLNLSRSKLYQLMDSGRLRYLKFGRARRIRPEAIENLLAASEVGGWAAGEVAP
jgi:excisionase family DNA binding protein